jgi:transcription elongation factor Elf1
MLDYEERSYTQSPVCPYCGDVDDSAWELDFGNGSDMVTNCGNCGEDYVITREIEITYTTEPIEKKDA